MLKLVTADPAVTLRGLVESGKQRSAGIKRMVQPRSINQRRYFEAIEECDMVFGVARRAPARPTWRSPWQLPRCWPKR